MTTIDEEKKVEFQIYFFYDKTENVISLDFIRQSSNFIMDFYEVSTEFTKHLKFLDEILNVPRIQCKVSV